MAGLFSRLWEKLVPKQMTKEEFIQKAKEVHGNYYDYSKVRYTDENTRVAIICPKHGKFLITPKEHIEGKGCEQCANKWLDGFESFINEQASKDDNGDNSAFWAGMIDDTFGEDIEENDNDESSEDNYIGEYSADKKTLVKFPEDYTGVYAIPQGVTKIGKYAFSYCRGLEEIKLPNSVSVIEEWAFGECRKLKRITIPEKVQIISKDTFIRCSSLKEIILPNDLNCIEAGAFSYCASLENLTFPQNLKIIQNDAFFECTSLKQIVLHNGVRMIDCSAFYRCDSLESIKLPQTIDHLMWRAFDICPNLKEILIPSGMSNSFMKQPGLKDLVHLFVEYPFDEVVIFARLCDNPNLRGEIKIKGKSIIVYDSKGNLVCKPTINIANGALPIKAEWSGSRIVVNLSKGNENDSSNPSLLEISYTPKL